MGMVEESLWWRMKGSGSGSLLQRGLEKDKTVRVEDAKSHRYNHSLYLFGKEKISKKVIRNL